MGNLLISKDLIVTRWTGFSEGSSSLPIANVPPGIDTISGISGSCAEIGAVAGAGDVLSLVLSSAPIGAVAGGAIGAVAGVGAELSLGHSSGACAGADADELPFGFSSGADAVAGNGSGVLALTASGWDVPTGVGA
jgi:hypothetical protein